MRPLKGYEVACSMLFAAALCVAALDGVRAQQRPSILTPGDVREIVVTHLPDDYFTRTQLSLERLRDAAGVRHVSLRSASEIRFALAAFSRRSPATADAYDARWEFVIVHRDGRRTHVGCNAFGNAGSYDGKPARLHLQELVRDLEHRYPVLRGGRVALNTMMREEAVGEGPHERG